jgi:Pvc16 N-terminal domain/Carboxypeptidase regulatory-like domain
MIRDLSSTLRAVLTQPNLPAELANAQIIFDQPSDSFRPSQTAIDLFLYDIRENIALRNNEPVIQRGASQAVIRQPPLRADCSYLVTAWAVGGTDLALQEHRLLSQALQVLSRYPIIPAAFLLNTLVGQEPPLPMLVARTDGLKNPAEFWTALGTRLRPSFTLTATIAIDIFPPETAPIALTSAVQLEQLGLADTQSETFRIGGRVTDAANRPVAGATVTLMERNLLVSTNANGEYNLGIVPAGIYTIRVQAGVLARQLTAAIPSPAGSNYDVQLT